MLAGRGDALAHPRERRRTWRRIALVLLPAGLAGGALAATLTVASGDGLGPAAGLGLMVQVLAAPASAAGYVAVLALWSLRPSWPRVARVLAPPGRMSLSVYLAQSVIASLLFAGYGAGLYGELGPAEGVVLAAGIWAGLAVLARLWLAGNRFGPAEWLLRSVTYLRRPPMRVAAERPTSG